MPCARFTTVLAVLLLTTAATGCASTGAVPRPFPVPSSTGLTGSRGSSGSEGSSGSQRSQDVQGSSILDGRALVETALALRGVPYRDGGADPKGFDCSGFTQYV